MLQRKKLLPRLMSGVTFHWQPLRYLKQYFRLVLPQMLHMEFFPPLLVLFSRMGCLMTGFLPSPGRSLDWPYASILIQ